MPAPTRLKKITFADMRPSGVRGLLIYCSDYHCSHRTAMSGESRWPVDVCLSDLEPHVCSVLKQRDGLITPFRTERVQPTKSQSRPVQ
jgi:hypothetical protein